MRYWRAGAGRVGGSRNGMQGVAIFTVAQGSCVMIDVATVPIGTLTDMMGQA